MVDENPESVDLAMVDPPSPSEDDQETSIILTHFKVIKTSNKTLPDQMSRLVHGLRVQ